MSKGGSTTWKFVLIKMHDENYKPPKKTVKIHWPGTLRKYGMQYITQYTPDEAENRLNRYYKYVIVRHPLDRVVSAYRDKMLQPDETCYQEEVGDYIKKKFRPENDTSVVQFHEFVQYLLTEDPLTFDRHWMPIQYVCQPCYVDYDYIAKVETLDTDAANIFHQLNASSSALPRLNTHGAVRKDHQYLQYFTNVTYQQFMGLVKLYELDFKLWGYDIPDFSLIKEFAS